MSWQTQKKTFEVTSEWSSLPIRMEDFMRGATWRALPISIKVALAHIWCAEQGLTWPPEPTPLIDQVKSRNVRDFDVPAGSFNEEHDDTDRVVLNPRSKTRGDLHG